MATMPIFHLVASMFNPDAFMTTSLPWDFIANPRITLAACSLYKLCQGLTAEQGRADVSLEKLARDMAVPPRKIYLLFGELIVHGWIRPASDRALVLLDVPEEDTL